jgi:acyl dehydratase
VTGAESFFSQYFDALSEGDRFTTRGRTVTESDVDSFAALTGDFHPVHTDPEWAASSPFGERIAHGMLVLSYAVGLVPLDPQRVVALRRIESAVFKHPARFGDTIRVEGQVGRLATVDDTLGLVACVWKVVNQDGKTVLRATVEVLWRREGSPASQGAESSAPGEAAVLQR